MFAEDAKRKERIRQIREIAWAKFQTLKTPFHAWTEHHRFSGNSFRKSALIYPLTGLHSVDKREFWAKIGMQTIGFGWTDTAGGGHFESSGLGSGHDRTWFVIYLRDFADFVNQALDTARATDVQVGGSSTVADEAEVATQGRRRVRDAGDEPDEASTPIADPKRAREKKKLSAEKINTESTPCIERLYTELQKLKTRIATGAAVTEKDESDVNELAAELASLSVTTPEEEAALRQLDLDRSREASRIALRNRLFTPQTAAGRARSRIPVELPSPGIRDAKEELLPMVQPTTRSAAGLGPPVSSAAMASASAAAAAAPAAFVRETEGIIVSAKAYTTTDRANMETRTLRDIPPAAAPSSSAAAAVKPLTYKQKLRIARAL